MRTRAASVRRLASAIPGVLFLFLALLASTLGARAEDIPRLAGPVTDLTNARVLAADQTRIAARIDTLLQNDDIQLFVLFVETTAARTVTAYADETARANSLGGNDVLLVVALADRTDALWRSDVYLDRLTDGELQSVLVGSVEPRLRAADYAGAAIACADGLHVVGTKPADGTIGPIPTSAPSTSIDLGFVVPIVLLGAGAIVLWSVFAARRREGEAAASLAQREAQRSQEANALLIRADEGLRDARQELGYAEAQFGDAEVAPYREALESAAVELKSAFAARQRLDDAVPEDAATRRQLVEEIATRATKAIGLLDEQRKRVDELRDLEKRAPQLLAELRERLAAARARIPEIERTLGETARYAERSTDPVRRNTHDAAALLDRVEAGIAAGESAVKAENAAAAAKTVRAAQQELAEAAKLLDAVTALDAALREAEQTAPARIADASGDLDTARGALAGGTAEQRQRLGQAGRSLDEARALMSATRPDVFAAAKLAADAHASIDTLLAEVRKEEERRASEARVAATQQDLARGAYERARDYIEPRRRTIGSTARTRLAEAQRHLDRAKALSDAGDRAGATEEAKRAQQLADEAWSLAQEDVRETERREPWTSSPRMSDLIVPILVGAALGRGGRSRGGGFFRPGGGGHSVGGSFGGFGGAAGGGGGGRSVGGKW